MRRASTLLVLLALGALHCSGSESPGEPPPPGETGGSSNTGGAPEVPQEGPLAINGCQADTYEDHTADDGDRTVLIAAEGIVYTPRCMTIARGQTVHWQGRLSPHPLAPGNPDDEAAGSPGNPIVPTSTGNSVDFTFENPGTFPYHCTVHSSGGGNGMAGAIHVTEF